MKLLIALALVASGIAFLPTAEACSPLSSCIPDEIVVCPDQAPLFCAEIDVRAILDRIIGPCTCPPIT